MTDQEMRDALPKRRPGEATPENLVPPVLPARYWTAVDFGLMTLEQAKAKWAKEQSEEGTPYHPLG